MYALFDCTGLLCNFRHAFRGIYVDDLWIVLSRDWTWGGVCVYNIYHERVVTDIMTVKASSPRSMVFSVSGVASPLGFHDLRKRKQISKMGLPLMCRRELT